MNDYFFESPVDGHVHHAPGNRNGCAVCEVQDERDGLRVVLDEKRALLAEAVVERDRLRAGLDEVRKKVTYFLTDRGLLPGDEVEINNRAWVLAIDESVVAEEGAPNFTVRYADGSTGTVPGYMVFRPRTNDQWKALYDIRNRT